MADIDLILACGDLGPRYLEFLVTFGHCPLLYIHGHVHLNYTPGAKRTRMYKQTKMINAYERCVFEFEQNLDSGVREQ